MLVTRAGGPIWSDGLRHFGRAVASGAAQNATEYAVGLIGLGDRKSVLSMADQGGEAGYKQLHHLVAAGIWDSATFKLRR